MKINHVPPGVLKPAKWRTTYTLRPDLAALEASMRDFGWLVPIVGKLDDQMVIDGHSRLAFAYAGLTEPDGNVPVVWVDCDTIDAMILHIRLNRGRGNPVPRKVSDLVKQIARSRKYPERELPYILNMTEDEFDLMMDGTILKARKVNEHEYSKAWVPVETKAVTVGDEIQIERPPNKDS